ncbi:MAG TPA: SDR family NAD(P)-dependent oxidoreductase [Pseudonocardiaceae bacterium]|nr:SDR family NAD(P)-dependent oxidoreductase [Pseudonocardiaceae bacterium]
MSASFANKVVLVTGASRGIGRAVALAFARDGAQLVLAARSAARLAEVETEVLDPGAAALSVPTDVSAPEAVGRGRCPSRRVLMSRHLPGPRHTSLVVVRAFVTGPGSPRTR